MKKIKICSTHPDLSLRERLHNPTSTQLPLFFSPNLGFLNRGLGPTVRETVLVTRHLVICRICFEIKWGWVKRACAGEFSAANTWNGGSTPWMCAAAGSLLLLCVCACSILRNKQRAGLGCGLTDRLPDIWAGPGGGWTNIGRPCVFQSWLILAGVQGHPPLPAETVNPI